MTEIEALRHKIDPLIGELETIAGASCTCQACAQAADMARISLAFISPLAAELARVREYDEVFLLRQADHMRAEIERLSSTLRQAQVLVCHHAPREKQSVRRPMRRTGRLRAEWKKDPLIPGTFILR